MKDPNQKIDIDSKTGRVRVRTMNVQPTMTQQQFAEECDINNIVKRYEKTGEIVHRNRKAGVYADFTEIKGYDEMLQTVIEAQEAFASLPAKVRARFKNDPGLLLEFIQDDKNYEEAQALGIVELTKKGAAESDLNAKSKRDPVKTADAQIVNDSDPKN